MRFFTNRAVAVIFTAVIMLVSVLANTNLMLGDASDTIADSFFSDTSGIYTQLSAKREAANGLWSLLESKGDTSASQLSDARRALERAYDMRDIEDMYTANQDLSERFDSAELALEKYDLSADELEELDVYVEQFDTAQSLIDSDDYNSTILDFQDDVLDKFPTNVLSELVGVEAPDMFSSS